MNRSITPNPEHMDRLEGFVVRRQVVAVTHTEQNTDNPPGRQPFREQEIVLAQDERTVSRKQLPAELAIIARNLPE
jgi:hypothetical protein